MFKKSVLSSREVDVEYKVLVYVCRHNRQLINVHLGNNSLYSLMYLPTYRTRYRQNVQSRKLGAAL